MRYHGPMAAYPSFRLGVLVLLPLAAAACGGNTTSANLPSIANPLDAERGDAVHQLNLLRQMSGVPQVTDCFSLNVSASAHSDDMRDNNYLAEAAPDGSTVRTRACMAGYTPACAGTIPMAELIALGYATGADTINQWAADATSGPILVNPALLWIGVGRAIGADAQRWTLDMAAPWCPE
jgi:uncharacterized protein YkwD